LAIASATDVLPTPGGPTIQIDLPAAVLLFCLFKIILARSSSIPQKTYQVYKFFF